MTPETLPSADTFPKGPTGLTMFKHLWRLRDHPLDVLTDLNRQYGNSVGLNVLGQKLALYPCLGGVDRRYDPGRIAAVLALRKSNDAEIRLRVRVAAAGCADDDLKQALDQV